ncbi:CHAT domain-containing protein [Pyxidicoccus fallax]|uniref:CHAT domain-containing protein n=1 Tax=Pyxidicoccus fallax TaxID=394095 RepID=A0A848LFZ4_9BACT|nr:CHAT domain-containing protein [Pyxidicoccus fallax]NMO17372.1 CHAT domain-containing protein [Pyxidicoccus fallax]NPC84085.1 CHAT domain-containing protein [Pyxidicoccus fallax]
MVKPAYDKVLILALATPVLVLTVLLARSPSKGSGEGVTPQFWAERRAAARIEARLTHPEADRHRPRMSSGGCPVPPEPIPLKELARLEEAGDWGGIAAAYALQGEWNQAASFLERMPASPNRDTDLAAVHLARGAHEKALRLLDAVLAIHPKHPQALWNRALVLQEMGLAMKAAETYEEVAALNEPGWGREAHAHALTLRDETLERARKWQGARDATLALLGDEKAPLPLELARQHPGVVRQHFYEVVRAAPSKERALALLPLAQELDRLQGGSALGDYVRRVAARDFARRGPLARGYAELVRGQMTGLDAVRQQARSLGEGDLFLGTLLLTKATHGPNLEEARTEVGRHPDPWLNLLMERELARKEVAEGTWWKAEQRIFSALQRCREGAFSARCVDLELRLAMLYIDLQRLSEAEQHARTAWTWARQLREWNLEFTALETLVHASRSRNDFASARAYVEEWAARGGRMNDCYWTHANLAHIYYLDAKLDAARREVDAAAACQNAKLDPMFAATVVELARTRLGPRDAELLKRSLAGVDKSVYVMPGDISYARYLEGRFMLEQDRAKGEALLRQTIDETKKLPRSDMLAREAWALSHSTLISEAGRAGDFPRALALMVEQLDTPAPKSCSMGLSVHGERTVVVVQGPEGQVRGYYDDRRQESFSRISSAHLIPDSLRQVLKGCARVDVFAWPPVLGRTDLLPPEIAWSFRLGRGARAQAAQATAPAPQQRLVVSSVEAPSLLQLPRLPAWTPPPDPEPTPMQVLTGSEATPSRVLASMRAATEIEIHAHGLVDPTISDSSLVVLSPEGDGRYALTADAVREQKLSGSPLVFLAACSAGRTTTSAAYEPFSLPAAFIDAGARAVLASTVDIPDAAGRFFDGVRRRIREGAAPAVALRDERVKWLEKDARASWTRHILLIETGE